MSVEFEATSGGKWLGLDAHSTELVIEVAVDGVEDSGLGMTLMADEARRLRRFLEYCYPAEEDPQVERLPDLWFESEDAPPPDRSTEPSSSRFQSGFEGLKLWRDGDQVLIEAAYDNGEASIWITLDADKLSQLRVLLADP